MKEKSTTEKLQDAKMELRRRKLLINAYENKLQKELDPDSVEWEETFCKYQETVNNRDNYLQTQFKAALVNYITDPNRGSIQW